MPDCNRRMTTGNPSATSGLRIQQHRRLRTLAGIAILLIAIAFCCVSCRQEDGGQPSAEGTAPSAADGLQSGSAETGDLPADRLVGHWKTIFNDHLYFGEPSDEGIGSYVVARLSRESINGSYEVLDQDADEGTVTVLLIFSRVNQREAIYEFSADGTEITSRTVFWGRELSTNLTYVDDLRKP